MKKHLGILLSILLLFNLFSGSINLSAAELIENGSFEKVDNGMPTGWEIPVGTPGKDLILTDKAFEGEVAIGLIGNKNVYITQSLTELSRGASYTLSFYMKREAGTDITVRADFTRTANGTEGYLSEYAVVKNLKNSEIGKWRQTEFTFVVPPSAEKTIIAFRKTGDAEVYFDDVKIQGGTEGGDFEFDETSGIEWRPRDIQNPENMVVNADFEKEADGFAADWRRFNPIPVTYVNDAAFAHSGTHSVRIATEENTYPWARVEIRDLVPGATCTYSVWMYSPTGADNIAFKTEYYQDFYDQMINTGNGASPYKSVAQKDGWIKLEHTEVVPDNSEYVWLYIRLYGHGEVYFDDVEYKLTKGPQAMNKLETDWIFYYSDWEGNGKASVSSNVEYYPEFIGYPVEFSVCDKTLPLYEETVYMKKDGTAEFTFPLTVLTEKAKEYTVYARLYDNDGSLIAVESETIYKYDRPAYIQPDGTYIENGERFDPVYIYHAGLDKLDKMKEIGINMLQGYADDTWMNELASRGMKQFIVLYEGGTNGKSAGHPDRIQNTINMVKKYKDHPAVFGWALMDEPNEKSYEDLKTAYRTIRELDPNHPIFITVPADHREAAKFCDVLSSDSYPYGMFPFTEHDYNTISSAVKALDGQKPVYDLLQAFDWRNSFPTADQIRNMAYQNFWAGGKAIGYYTMNDCVTNPDGTYTPMDETHLWAPLKSFYELEYKDALAHFVYGEYPTFCEVRNEDYWYRAWVKGNEIQLVVLNRNEKENSNAKINLTSADGKIKLGNITATVVNGADYAPISSNDGSFEITLEPSSAVLFTISTDEDLSKIESSRFMDMYEHGWADKALKAIDEAGIIHSELSLYRPAENITRGDFAYMLIRALGLKASEGEGFADVDERDYYQKELITGKKLGIFNGVGDNTFNKNAPISRQDMMTMCYRAILTADKAEFADTDDLAKYSDALSVADYAVKAVAAMTQKEIVTGNADGTLNPLGNTTRAEAAVIIERIFSL